MANGAYVDSCIFIYLLQQQGGDKLEACRDLMERAETKKELVIVTSAWTIIEVNKIDQAETDPRKLEECSKQILRFFENKYIEVKPLNRETAELAHQLTRTHGLTNADSVHVATALLSKVPVLYTYDDPKKKRRGLIRHSLQVGGTPPLRIEKPPIPSAGPLFEKKEEESGSEGSG
jgi:predicted nucleic acid-binding protein